MKTVKSETTIGHFTHFYWNYSKNKFIWRWKY